MSKLYIVDKLFSHKHIDYFTQYFHVLRIGIKSTSKHFGRLKFPCWK